MLPVYSRILVASCANLVISILVPVLLCLWECSLQAALWEVGGTGSSPRGGGGGGQSRYQHSACVGCPGGGGSCGAGVCGGDAGDDRAVGPCVGNGGSPGGEGLGAWGAGAGCCAGVAGGGCPTAGRPEHNALGRLT